MYLLGYDVGSSSVKASLINAETGRPVASAFHPKQEMKIDAPKPGWAEQDPNQWWTNLILATNDVLQSAEIDPSSIKSIGIAYQNAFASKHCVLRGLNAGRNCSLGQISQALYDVGGKYRRNM